MINKMTENKEHQDVNPLLWKLRREVDDRIEPILIEKEYDETDFLSEVKKIWHRN